MARNKIIAAAEREQDEELLREDEDEGEFYDDAGVTVDEMNSLMDAVDKNTARQVDATRQRGGKNARAQASTARPSRAQQARREPETDRPGDWRPADTLYAPPPKPGNEQRWIRVRLGEKDDPRNFQKKFREGWVPVKLSEVDESYNPPSDKFGRYGDVIMVSDLVLCERSMRIGAARKAHFAEKLSRHLASAHRRAVDSVQRDGHRIQVGLKTDSIHGRGRRNRTPVQDDAE